MKNLFSILATLLTLTATFLVSGCGGPAKTKLDTSELLNAFASSDAAVKSQVEAAAKTLNSGSFLDGTSALAKVAKASYETLTEPQKTSLLNLVTQIQTIMAEDGNKADMKIYQAADDLIAGIEGRESTKVGITPDMLRPAKPAAE